MTDRTMEKFDPDNEVHALDLQTGKKVKVTVDKCISLGILTNHDGTQTPTILVNENFTELGPHKQMEWLEKFYQAFMGFADTFEAEEKSERH